MSEKIGLCQLRVTLDKNNNIANARSSIEFASNNGARLVILPEMWNCPYSMDYFTGFAETFDDKDRKIHMFDIDVPGDISFKESDIFSAGDEPTIVDTDVGRIGIGICHDIRFPELAMVYRARGFFFFLKARWKM